MFYWRPTTDCWKIALFIFLQQQLEIASFFFHDQKKKEIAFCIVHDRSDGPSKLLSTYESIWAQRPKINHMAYPVELGFLIRWVRRRLNIIKPTPPHTP